MSRARTIVFWVLVCAVVVGHAIVAWHSLVVQRFWEDEAFNLTVPRNLLAGLGYASDGALSGSTLTLFDARISTGPVVLLPIAAVLATGADLVVGARLVPLAYWVLLLAGLAVLGRRLGGRWAALLAVAVPLAFTAVANQSPIQGPADILGEIPAAALLVWALVVLPRRAWLAGLLVGLAVQAKLIALLALPAFAIALWVLAEGRGWARVRDALRRAWLPLLLVAVPTFLFELAALFTFGLGGFIDHLRSLVAFVRSGGQVASTTVAEKLATLGGAWSLPGVVALLALVLLLGLVVAGIVTARRDPRAEDRPVVALIAASAVGALAFIAWWSTASHLPLWIRHPAVGLLAFLPVLAAAAIWAVRRLPRGTVGRVAIGAGALLFAVVAVGGAQHVSTTLQTQGQQTLQDQRDAAAPIAAWVDETGTEWLGAAPWGASVSIILLTDAHLGLFDAPSMQEFPQVTDGECTTPVLVPGDGYRVCAAPAQSDD